MMTTTEIRTCWAIVRCFETSSPRGNYGAVAVLAGDTGGLSYGVCQATRASGNLYLLVKQYVAAHGRYGDHLAAFLAPLYRRAWELDTHPTFRRLLERAGDDPVMRGVQDSFFESRFWGPVNNAGQAMGLVYPLSYAVLFDSQIQGGRTVCTDRTNTATGGLGNVGEQGWITRYVREREAWLFGLKSAARKTTYRTHALADLIDRQAWDLALPLEVLLSRGAVTIRLEDLGLTAA